MPWSLGSCCGIFLGESLWGNGKSMGNLLSDSCWGIDVGKYGILVRNLWPRCSMYGIFTYICPKNCPNVSKYTIHGAYGWLKCLNIFDLGTLMAKIRIIWKSVNQSCGIFFWQGAHLDQIIGRKDQAKPSAEGKKPCCFMAVVSWTQRHAGPFDAFCGSVEDGSLMEMIPVGSRIPTQQLTPWHKTWEKSWEFNSSKKDDSLNWFIENQQKIRIYPLSIKT